MFGICFGHQIMAQAMGGRVEKSDRGWGLGRHAYTVIPTAAPGDLGARELSMQVLHQDQVIEPPAQASVFACSEFCPVAGLWYPGKALSIQGHPEFEADFLKAVLKLRRGHALPIDAVDSALNDIDCPNNRDVLARFLLGGASL